jgi:sugar phosphate isomerase/epimerase
LKVGLSTLYCLGQPFTVLLRELETVDVESIEVMDDGHHALDETRVEALKKIIEKRGFATSVHAPFVDINIASPSKSIRTTVLKRLKRSIQFSSELGSEFWVFHPGLQTGISHFTPGLDWELNLESVREMLSAAREFGVNITIENGLHTLPFLLRTADDFIRFYEDLGETGLGLTFDVGHANVNSQINDFFEKLPEKIVHAHLHDNHGRTDEHLGLGDGTIDWLKIVRAFRKIDFKGTLVVESEKNVEESVQKLKALINNI